MGNNSTDNIAVLVISCDNYKDLWEPFVHFFNENWKDCPYDKYLITNESSLDIESDFISLKVGEDLSWSDNLIKALSSLKKYDYLFLFLEDMFINKKVNQYFIDEQIQKFIKRKGHFLTFLNEPKPDRLIDDFVGEIDKGALYRCTATAALWKSSTLVNLLIEGESAWGFEKNGAIRSDSYKGFYSMRENQISWINAVIKNKWTRKGAKAMTLSGFKIEKTNKKVMSYSETVYAATYKNIRKIILLLFPKKLKREFFNKYS